MVLEKTPLLTLKPWKGPGKGFAAAALKAGRIILSSANTSEAIPKKIIQQAFPVLLGWINYRHVCGLAYGGRALPEHGQDELDGAEVKTAKAAAFSYFPWLGLCKRELHAKRACFDTAKCTQLSKSQGASGLDLLTILISGS